MHLDAIQKILQHWLQRQEASGPESAFWFSIVIGPHKKFLQAAYPDPVVQGLLSKSKGKGKEKESDPLQGLYRISESVRTTPTSQDDTSIHRNHASTQPVDHRTQQSEDDLVVVDMGGMLQLREMGCVIIGPVNGPNEGLPQYLVPKSWVDRLTWGNDVDPAPVTWPYPRPRPVHNQSQDLATLVTAPRTVIDPALMNSETGAGQASTNVEIGTGPGEPIAQRDLAGGGLLEMPLTSQPNEDTICDVDQGSSSQSRILIAPQLQDDPDSFRPEPGPSITSWTTKCVPIDMSPTSARQTRSKQRRRVVRDDEQAAMEAQQLLRGRRMSKRHAKQR